MNAAPIPAPEAAGSSRRALAGFFLSGMLISLVGAILPAWGYHWNLDYTEAGAHFLSLNAGMLISLQGARKLIPLRGASFVLTLASLLASASLCFLAYFSPPASYWWRLIGLLWLGVASGWLNTAMFHAISPMYKQDRAATVNLSGILFGLGCFVTALLVAGTFYVYTVVQTLLLLAVVPIGFAVLYGRVRFPPDTFPEEPLPDRVRADLRSPAAILFALLLFFQFGNEWAIAGWLPLFLNQRVGVSPATSLVMLAIFWLTLTVGRVAMQSILPRVSHARLLMASVVAALFGCTILAFTDNAFGATVGILLAAGGFTSIYPLVVERIGSRFTYYHPGFYNGVFSFAVTGGLLAPWILGYLAEWWSLRAVMLAPMLGTGMVFVLLLLIWLEARLSGSESARARAGGQS